MKISLIIPTFNRGHLIDYTLSSVLNQSYDNWECIVVDDGSTDNTKNIIQKFILEDDRFFYFSRPSNRQKGANSCRNYGFEQSTGQIINWLDSDDLLATNHFEFHVNRHRANNFDCVVSKAKNFVNDPEEENGMWSKVVPVKEAWKDMIAGRISWATPTVSWKRESLTSRPFDEKLQGSQEWFFHVSRLLHGINFDIAEIDTIRVRRHDNRIGTSSSPQKFKSKFLSRFNIFKILQKENRLFKEEEYFLLKEMMKSLHKTSKKKYFFNTTVMSYILIKLSFRSSYSRAIYKSIIYGVPICLITGRGEILFSLNRN